MTINEFISELNKLAPPESDDGFTSWCYVREKEDGTTLNFFISIYLNITKNGVEPGIYAYFNPSTPKLRMEVWTITLDHSNKTPDSIYATDFLKLLDTYTPKVIDKIEVAVSFLAEIDSQEDFTKLSLRQLVSRKQGEHQAYEVKNY